MIIKVILIAIVVLITLFLLLKYLFPVAQVEGDSMLPTYREGEYLICRRVFFKKKCKVNKIYVIYLRDDEKGKPYYVIKRLNKILCGGDYWFLGDNADVSYDSRHYGGIDPKRVIAEVRKVCK